ncbi:MAG: Hsp20/alpha crystallin family protein [Actinomycetota bacterium]|nr:Hsp20/alpha crystallin family protein [Actinomycetota bacterium]
MLMRFDPFREVERWTHQLSAGTRAGLMPIDAYRQGDHWVAAFDLPGFDPGSIDVTVEGNTLTVQAERSWEPKEGEQIVISERPQGVFTRRIALGEGLDTDHVEALYEAGVLTVRLPVAEQAKARRVAITSGAGQQALEAGSEAA